MRLRKLSALLMLVVMCLTAFCIEASASEGKQAELPVTVEVTGDAPSTPEDYIIKLQVIDGSPMPAADTLTVKGSGKAAFPVITYEEPGIYCYKVFQQAGSNTRCEYDATVYYVRISVTNTDTGLGTVIAVHTDEGMTSEKSDIIFKNNYKAKPTVKPTETPKPPKKGKISPNTGDNSHMALWFTLICICLAGAAVAVIAAIKRKNKKTDK